MTTYRHQREAGGISGSLIAIIALIILVLGAGSAAIWAYMNYSDQKTNVDSKVEIAVVKAQKEQFDKDFKDFQEKEKEPNRQFVGPDDYGRVTFNYPKTWSSYIARDVARGGVYEVYFNPVAVPPISASERYALRVTIAQTDYDQAVKSYESLVKKGDLRSSVVSANGNSGTRIDGNFTKDIRGAAVIYKIRDKTVTIRTDADTFKPDFESLIQTIKFNS